MREADFLERIILKRILEKHYMNALTVFSLLRLIFVKTTEGIWCCKRHKNPDRVNLK